MSIDFSTLQGLTIPEGIVTQIADASGRVLWAVQSGDKVILEVEKITSDTYANSTTYKGEQFVLISFPYQSNVSGEVSVTFGGLTKTITLGSGGLSVDKVFFGTFNGVSDSVETPASGTLTIEGVEGFLFTVGNYNTTKSNIAHCNCVTKIVGTGSVTQIPGQAFYNNTKLKNAILSKPIISIGADAFAGCTGLESVTIHQNITSIGARAFSNCSGLKNIDILATIPPVLSQHSVFGGSTGTITVPTGFGAAYKTAEYWSEYADRIVEAS